MKKWKKVLICLMLIIPIVLFGIKVKADSGFDFDWDSGGSSWDSGGSSWDSDWGSSWGSSSGSGIYIGGGGGNIITFIIVIIIIIYVIRASKKGNAMGITLDHTKEISDEEIRNILGEFNKGEFLGNRFNDFVEIQEGWMNFDYDLLKTKLTDELYNQYVMQLDTLQVKNQKNIMSDFNNFDSMITSISKDGDKVTITMELLTSFYDYLEEDGKVVRGNKNIKGTMHYEMTFVTNLVSHKECPNCGAKLPKTNVCEYCHTVVPNVGNDWVLSKKEAIRQR